MAMNSGTLAASMRGKLVALLAGYLALNDDDNDSHLLTGFDQLDWLNRLCQGVSEAVVEHIQGGAQAVGTDSHGDTHDLNIL